MTGTVTGSKSGDVCARAIYGVQLLERSLTDEVQPASDARRATFAACRVTTYILHSQHRRRACCCNGKHSACGTYFPTPSLSCTLDEPCCAVHAREAWRACQLQGARFTTWAEACQSTAYFEHVQTLEFEDWCDHFMTQTSLCVDMCCLASDVEATPHK